MNPCLLFSKDEMPRERISTIEKHPTIERDFNNIEHNIKSLEATADLLLDHAMDMKQEIQKVRRSVYEKSASKVAKAKPKKNNS